MIKHVLIMLIFIGILLIAISLAANSATCAPPQIIYRYIPRTFEEEQNEPVYVSDIFKSMFEDQSPWIGDTNDIDTRNKDSINKYFISQI
jgi:hypothetical protein